MAEKNAGDKRADSLFGAWLKRNKMAASVWAGAHLGAGRKPRWSVSAVRAWMLPKEAVGARACPEDAAILIAKETKGAVPAVEASWPSGISWNRRKSS